MPLNGQQYHSRELCDVQQFFVDLKMYESKTIKRIFLQLLKPSKMIACQNFKTKLSLLY